jgi:hypothetical protein
MPVVSSISHIINITSDYHSQLHKIIVGNVLRSKGLSLQEDYEKWEHSGAPSSSCVLLQIIGLGRQVPGTIGKAK